MEEPAHEGMQVEAEPALIEGHEHDHLIISRMGHFTIALQSPPRNLLRGNEPFFSRPRRRLSRIEQARNDTMCAGSKTERRKEEERPRRIQGT
jgi:hypothetical protein